MRYFSCLIFDAENRRPTRSFILAEDDRRAMALARRELLRMHRATHAELRENGQLVGVERLL